MPLTLSNRQARRILIQAHGLSKVPTGRVSVPNMVSELGFVQLDTIRNVTRAHHHILWSRNRNYREPMIREALEARHVFEHFTHDASLLPIDVYPVWHWQFKRLADRMEARASTGIDACLYDLVKNRIREEGALCTKAFDTKIKGPKAMWSRPPHKRALDHLWYKGELATCHRKNFTKFYDLPERVIPNKVRQPDRDSEQQFNYLCERALDHLVIATPADLQDFWGAASAVQIKNWLTAHRHKFEIVKIKTHDGAEFDAVAVPNIEDRLAQGMSPGTRLRLLNPFDPLIRNRKRLSRVFGFEYKIEIFVPQAARKWGYYVYPLLEGDRFIGRVELKADRKAGQLSVLNLWLEPGFRLTASRAHKLQTELRYFARLAEINQSDFDLGNPVT